MVKIAKKNWKPVELNANVFAGGIDGLIGIEECTDYDDIANFTYSKKKSIKLAPKKKKELISPSKSGTTVEETVSEIKETADIEAWYKFGLPKCILDGLSELNFAQPTEIQQLTLPAAIMGRRDILGAAETGSGKTLAFGLPILNGILQIKDTPVDDEPMLSDESEEELDEPDENGLGCVKVETTVETIKPLYALILTPTRELAMQIKSNLAAFTKHTNIHVAVVVGGMAAVKQERILSKGPEIVVATPGRLWELIQSGNPHLSQIDSLRFLAIDETDRMLEKGHFQELHNLLERINFDEERRKLRQNFVFSATLTLVHDLPKHLVNKRKIRSKKVHEMTAAQKLQKIVDILGISEPKIVDITQGSGTSSTLTECRITCPIEEKDYYVYYFLKKHEGRTLIFCNSIGCVKRLTTLLGLLGCHPLPLHASMQQRQRLKNLERFRDVDGSILVATDVAARGLDIPCVEHVLHYQTPRTSEGYVHRSGRTARASRQGITVLLIEPKELQNYLKICRTLGKVEDIPIFPVKDNFLNAVKQRVNLARELDVLELQVKKANSEEGWFQKAAEDMDIIVDDMAKRYDFKGAKTSKKVADIKRKQLQLLLSKPIFPKDFSAKYPLSSGELSIPMVQGEQVEEKAVDVMKNAIETYAKLKRKPVPLYKPRKTPNVKAGDSLIKLTTFKKKRNSNRTK